MSSLPNGLWNGAIFLYTIVVIYIVHLITKKYFCNSDKRELAEISFENLPQDQRKLLSKLEFLEKKIIRLTDKLNTLQMTSNISKEQLDYATSNLNGIALAP